MASCSMASAATGFVVTPNVTSNTNTVKCTMVMFSSKTTRSSRLVVKAADEAAPPAAPAAPAKEAAPKPPPIGPKRGTQVKGTMRDGALNYISMYHNMLLT